MELWLVFILLFLIVLAVFLFGCLCGAKFQKTSKETKEQVLLRENEDLKKQIEDLINNNELHFIGQLLVDTDDKSVYMSFIEDPQKLKNGELVSIQALVVESQQKQDS